MNKVVISKCAIDNASYSPLISTAGRAACEVIVENTYWDDYAAIYLGDGTRGIGFYTSSKEPFIPLYNEIDIAVILMYQAKLMNKFHKTTPYQLGTAMTKFNASNPVPNDRINYPDWRALNDLSKENNAESIYYWHQPQTFSEDEYEFFFFLENAHTIHHVVLTPAFYETLVSSRPKEEQVYHLKEEKNITINESVNEKEKKTMNIPGIKFDFGALHSDNIALSPYGLAIRNAAGQFLAYKASDGQTVDVTGMTFDLGDMIYKFPVALAAVAPGDMVMHNNKPMYVTSVEDNSLDVIDIVESEVKIVIPVTNMFGFNFITKIMTPINFDTTPNPDQPFGNLMPIMMMSMFFNKDEDEAKDDKDFAKMMMIMSMANGANPFTNMFKS